MRTLIKPVLILTGILGSTLHATEGFQLHYAQVVGLDGLKKVTNAGTGFILGAGLENGNGQVPWRLGLDYAIFPGKTAANGLKTSLTSFQLSGDVFVQTPISHLRLVTGLSLNKYSLKNTGNIWDGEGNLVASFPVDDDRGIKLGLRVGFEYRFNPRLSGELMFQATELGATPPVVANNADGSGLGAGYINPAWLQVGIRYHF